MYSECTNRQTRCSVEATQHRSEPSSVTSIDTQHAPAHLPKSHEDDRLDQHKLEQGVIGSQEVMRTQVEQQQRIQRYCVCDVVHNCDPQVSAAYHSCQRLTF